MSCLLVSSRLSQQPFTQLIRQSCLTKLPFTSESTQAAVRTHHRGALNPKLDVLFARPIPKPLLPIFHQHTEIFSENEIFKGTGSQIFAVGDQGFTSTL